MSRRGVDSSKRRFLRIACNLALVWLLTCRESGLGESEATPPPTPPVCSLNSRFFEDEVWAKVGERTCLRCHNAKGDAAESGFVLQPRRAERDHDVTWLKQNCDAFLAMAKSNEVEHSRLLLKVTGGLDHGGGPVLKTDSTGYRILERYVRRVSPSTLASNASPRFLQVPSLSFAL